MDSITSSPVSDEPVTEVQMAPIQGSDFGGHAPLVGAHIYLVQPGTAGYGSVVKSLLTKSNNPSTFPIIENGSWSNSGYASDQFVPTTDAVGNPFYGVLADSSGSFNIGGDYTCTVNKPVILIGYGGSPSYVGEGTGTTGSAQTDTFAVGTASEVNNTGSSNFTFTYTTKTAELFYPGELVTVSGYPSLSAGFNNFGTVLASGLTTTSFSITVPYGQNTNLANNTPTNLSDTTDTGSVVANPPFNPAAVNMAVLGNCPSSGNFSTAGNGAISFIYMNEVSTTAAAYAMAGFINTAATDQSGNDEFHIGASNTTQGQQGIANAAITAGLLYDIQGSSQSTSFAGEGHIARSVTPNGGYGTVPLETIDTIANILAACVDSTNTYRQQTGTVSTACNVLEATAQDNGVVDGDTIKTAAASHVAFNIAQAAFNMARFPQGAGTGTTNGSGVTTVNANNATTAASYVSALYGLPTGNVPFTPNLVSPRSGVVGGKPNDFSIPLLWTVGSATTDVEIDPFGNAFILAGSAGLYEITPSGVMSNPTPGGVTLSTALSAGMAIDYVGNVWTPAMVGNYVYAPAVGVNGIDGLNTVQGSGIAVDSLQNQYVASGNNGSTLVTTELAAQSAINGVPFGAPFPIVGSFSAAANTSGACEAGVGFVTLDSSNNIWTTTSVNATDYKQYLCRFSNAGALQYSLMVPSTGDSGGFSFPRGLAIDAADNVFFSDKNLDGLYMVARGTAVNNTFTTLTKAPGQLRAPSWVAVDGANTVWVSSTGDGGASKPGTGLVQFSDAGVILTSAYITGAPLLASPTTCLNSVAIDPSGNVWSAEGTGQGTCGSATQVNEYVGLATPTRTPIAAAKATTGVGTKP